jgi:regulator of sigma E protease
VSILVSAGLVVGALQLFGGGAFPGSTVVVSLIALGVLIFIHELGHFLIAKAVGVGVERFSLGFGPRLWAFRRGETEYCVSVVPLGGYVKMIGEEAHGEDTIHPGTATPAEARSDPRKSFALKPLWARALIVFAGPAMNFVLAAVIFSMIFLAIGVPTPPSGTVGRVLPDTPAAAAGLRTGDQVVAIDGKPIEDWSQVEALVVRAEGRPLRLTVMREAQRLEATVTPRRISTKTPFGEPTETWSLGATPYFAPVVGGLRPGMAAADAGLRVGDRIVAIDGQSIATWDEMAEIISRRAGQPIRLTIERSGQRLDLPVTPQAVTERDPLGNETKVGRIGIELPQLYKPTSPVSAVGRGIRRTWEMSVMTLVGFWKLATRVIPASNIGGPLQIGILAGQAAQEGLVPYALLVAFISVNLAILNLLPVPMLDGGHLLFFAIEGVLGRPVSIRKREIAQQIGLALLLLLMVFAIGNDIWRYFPVDKFFK